VALRCQAPPPHACVRAHRTRVSETLNGRTAPPHAPSTWSWLWLLLLRCSPVGSALAVDGGDVSRELGVHEDASLLCTVLCGRLLRCPGLVRYVLVHGSQLRGLALVEPPPTKASPRHRACCQRRHITLAVLLRGRRPGVRVACGWSCSTVVEHPSVWQSRGTRRGGHAAPQRNPADEVPPDSQPHSLGPWVSPSHPHAAWGLTEWQRAAQITAMRMFVRMEIDRVHSGRDAASVASSHQESLHTHAGWRMQSQCDRTVVVSHWTHMSCYLSLLSPRPKP
jgi:hypothetical protein